MAGEMSRQQVLAWLQERHDQIMDREKEALEFLKKGDVDKYNACMRQKAELLEKLYASAVPVISGLPASARSELDSSLQRFSAGAHTALRINSVFYMSALLYPDEYRAGEPDNLQAVIDALAKA